MISNLLVATDLHTATEPVIQKAKEIADKFNAKISIIHVVEFLPANYGNLEFASPVDAELLTTLENSARINLNKLADKYKIPPANRYLEIGSVKNEVLALAKKIAADLLVIGSHGRHGVELLLGSSANALLHAAKCNVLAVKIKQEQNYNCEL
jgi:universal stress protein A